MTVKEAIKMLEINGFTRLNQVGSHIKYGKDQKRYTIVLHKSTKETLCPKAIKNLKLILTT